MSYAQIDPEIHVWAKRHALALITSWQGSEARSTYVSSDDGDCFQIWIERPADGRVSLHAAGVEGRRADLPPRNWNVAMSDIAQGLEDAFNTVIDWMRPSQRRLPTAKEP
jgi:hypothetical protein